MNFDEQSNSEFPVALNAPGRFNETENGIDSQLAPTSEVCTSARMHAPGLAKTSLTNTRFNPAAMVFALDCIQEPVASGRTATVIKRYSLN